MTHQTELPDPLPFVSRDENEPLTLSKVIEFFKLVSNPDGSDTKNFRQRDSESPCI